MGEKTILGSGAEAVIYKEKDSVVKERIGKSYRIKELDERLRQFRTRREAKVLERAGAAGILVPGIKKMDDRQMVLKMDFIDGQKLSAVFEKIDYKKYSKEIADIVSRLHKAGIIHADLTTSNFILKEGKLYIIDFGLSFFSDKEEDKAVDLHLLKQALDSKHYTIAKECFKIIKQHYPDKAVWKRFEKVELRGRNKKGS